MEPSVSGRNSDLGSNSRVEAGDRPWGWTPHPTLSVLLTQPTSFLLPLAASVTHATMRDHAGDFMATIILYK